MVSIIVNSEALKVRWAWGAASHTLPKSSEVASHPLDAIKKDSIRIEVSFNGFYPLCFLPYHFARSDFA